MKITTEDLQAWEACKDGYRWFLDTFGAEAEFSEFVAKCQGPDLAFWAYWVGWVCYHAGLNWADDRYIPAIAEALIRTGDAEHLYQAGRDWADSRYIPAIAEALVKAGSAWWLYHAGCDWADDRYTPAIAEALVKAGYVWLLYHAGLDWAEDRYTPAVAKALIKTGDAVWRDRALQAWPEARKKDLERSKK